MMKEKDIKIIMNQNQQSGNAIETQAFTLKDIAKVRAFHQSFGGYRPTPLRKLTCLAAALGVGGFYVKDESYRFGLNAFKVLGGAYAIGRFLAGRLQMDIADLSFEMLRSPEIKQKLGEITFVTATDGNHGRGVAWAATQLGQKSVVYMPKGSSKERLINIRKEGGEASITDLNYDDAVRLAAKQARQNGWIVVQDTAWEDYYDIPLWIMQGYATSAMEACQQLTDLQVSRPTHVFLQAGVGSFAGAVQAFLVHAYPDQPPKVIIVEPNAADCLFRSAAARDGKARFVGGEMNTIMAGLACGEPNDIGWNILRQHSEMFLSCPDWVAARGMRVLGNPIGTDARIVSGESGAVTTGAASLLATSSSMSQTRRELGLDETSQVLVFSTEGDTDSKKYRSIVWDGAYPSPADEEEK